MKDRYDNDINIGDILIPDVGQRVKVIDVIYSEGIEYIEGRQVAHPEFGCLISQENLSIRWTKEVT